MSTFTSEDIRTDVASEYDQLHRQADDLVDAQDLISRVTWLQRIGVSDEAILDGLLDPTDPGLERLVRDWAHDRVDQQFVEDHSW